MRSRFNEELVGSILARMDEMPAMRRLRPQSRWLARQLARDAGISEESAEQGLLQLIAHGHLRVIKGGGPEGSDAFQPIIKKRIAKR
ncbi:MAG TPA: hypothetical protein VNX86_15280 [Rhizomicrobium sp.]|jgi:hypothetical protein|nr:hypothetical protein [Rhizomicrobium sp.]